VEFLRAQFHQELDYDGEIIIAGENFARHDILAELAPEPYRIAFNDWLEQRKERLLTKADEILARYDNGRRFDRLVTAYKAGKMIPFIGAGMSAASGYPTWTQFLYDLCNESHVQGSDLGEMLFRGEYEEAVQAIHDDLGSALFNENLEAAFAREKQLAGAIHHLPALFSKALVITTNFDLVVERIFENGENEDAGFDLVVSGRSLAEVLRQIAAGGRLLIKLHGDCRKVGDRVLLKSEYDTAYSDKGVVKQFFSRVMFGQSILFLGCSLTADRTITAMKQIAKEFTSEALPRHYAILELKKSDDRVARKKHLSEANIFPIFYEEGEHDESIEALLLKLSTP
jgi:hypothetical protein